MPPDVSLPWSLAATILGLALIVRECCYWWITRDLYRKHQGTEG